MRIFFAIEFEKRIIDQLIMIQQEVKTLAKSGHYTLHSNFHLTLEFIGEVNEVQLNELKQVLLSLGNNRKSFSLRTNTVGSFKRRNDHIVWLGLNEEPALKKLASDLKKELKLKGYFVEERPYKAHITLGRRVRIKEHDLESLNKHNIIIDVNRISIMESKNVDGKLFYEQKASVTLI